MFAPKSCAASTVDKEQEATLLDALRERARKAYKWFVGGGNFCADIYQIHPNDKVYKKDAGKWKAEIISNYMAQLNKGIPLWRKKYPTARRVMTLKINDMVKAEFCAKDDKLPKGIADFVKAKAEKTNADKVEVIFRVKKMSSEGTIFLRPDGITKEEGDTKSWSSSAASLCKYKARKIYVSPLGDVTDKGFDNKWLNDK
ncbi:hypothetical protein RsTz2092_12570 [Deferribacterales bacterium RsTz2092]